MTKITIDLSDEHLAGLRHWHTVNADFGDVEHNTGADLIVVLNDLAKQATAGETTERLTVNLARSEAQGEPRDETIGPFDYVQITYDTLECCRNSDTGSQFTTFHIDGGGGMWFPQKLEPMGDSRWESSGPDLSHHGWTDITIHPAD